MRTILRTHPKTTTSAWTRTSRLAGTLALSMTLLVGCGSSSQTGAATIEGDNDGYQGSLVDPPLEMAPVTLRDTDGNPVRIDRLSSGKVTAFFFGFTNCDDVCPTTMADLASARRSLPPQVADQVELVFITVDPERDTPQVLRTWLDQFDTDILGLRGPVATVHEAERSLYASESGKALIDPSPTNGNDHSDDHGDEAEHAEKSTGGHTHGGAGYEVEHTSVVYLFGPDSETVIYTGDGTVDDYAADFEQLVG